MSIWGTKNTHKGSLSKYIKQQFVFLLQRGYKLTRYTRSVEEEYVFESPKIVINLYKVCDNMGVTVYDADDAWRAHGISLNDLLELQPQDDRLSDLFQQTDYFAELVQNNIDKIENYFCN